MLKTGFHEKLLLPSSLISTLYNQVGRNRISYVTVHMARIPIIGRIQWVYEMKRSTQEMEEDWKEPAYGERRYNSRIYSATFTRERLLSIKIIPSKSKRKGKKILIHWRTDKESF